MNKKLIKYQEGSNVIWEYTDRTGRTLSIHLYNLKSDTGFIDNKVEYRAWIIKNLYIFAKVISTQIKIWVLPTRIRQRVA